MEVTVLRSLPAGSGALHTQEALPTATRTPALLGGCTQTRTFRESALLTSLLLNGRRGGRGARGAARPASGTAKHCRPGSASSAGVRPLSAHRRHCAWAHTRPGLPAGSRLQSARPGYNWSPRGPIRPGLACLGREKERGRVGDGGRPCGTGTSRWGRSAPRRPGCRWEPRPPRPGWYLLGRRRRMSPGRLGPKAACRVPWSSVQSRRSPRSRRLQDGFPHPPPRRLPPARARVPQLPRASGGPVSTRPAQSPAYL